MELALHTGGMGVFPDTRKGWELSLHTGGMGVSPAHGRDGAISAPVDGGALLGQPGSATPAAGADRISKFLHLCVTQYHLSQMLH